MPLHDFEEARYFPGCMPIEALAERAYRQCHPLENIIVDPEWRRAMVPVYVRRALNRLRRG